jgi:hypothetical protein
LLTKAEQKDLIHKAHLDITDFDYARFKFSQYSPFFNQKLTNFEAQGAPELAVAKELRAYFEKINLKFAEHRYFANETSYSQVEAELLSAYLQGNLEKTSDIAESVDLRRIPLH